MKNPQKLLLSKKKVVKNAETRYECNFLMDKTESISVQKKSFFLEFYLLAPP